MSGLGSSTASLTPASASDGAIDDAPPKGVRVGRRHSTSVGMHVMPDNSGAGALKLSLRNAVFSLQGKRKTMEDEHCAIPVIPRRGSDVSDRSEGGSAKPGPQTRAFFGVYDGHGGSRAAEFVSAHLHEFIFESPAFKTDPQEAMRQGIAKVEEKFLDLAVESELADGTTATVALIHGNELIVANVGDSEAVLCRSDQAIAMSAVHNVKENPDEEKRVVNEGGLIYRNRVGHPSLNPAYFSIGVSRAIGDLMFKHHSYTESKPSGITAEPEFKKVVLTPQDRFVLLACDGLWGVITHQEACDFVLEKLGVEKDLELICKALVDKAYDAGSTDNITAMIVMLHE
eukprot:TRINITY_DN4654_c0_g1_i1.p1 TRINITY_DN4654_c0_g1~~TRINITY_DN4654_c0_g1_i1.p1  ORF type:complete len:343 (+),score=70.38 TRINITY_DN4654_c0_g1_i1:1446-2474(+)